MRSIDMLDSIKAKLSVVAWLRGCGAAGVWPTGTR